ncbi:MAG: PKD domain-containing protein, partial [Actinomycetes bacterium]
FNLSPGNYTFTVRATDRDGLTTATANRGSLTVTAQVPGDAFPDGLLSNPGLGTSSLTSPHLDLAGTATDDKGVASVRVAILENNSRRYLRPNGTLDSGFATVNATVASPNATSTTWTLPVDLPSSGDYRVTVWAWDTAGQQDTSTVGATGRYLYFPGDQPPTFDALLGAPSDGATFAEGRIVVTGRALDDFSIARVEAAFVDSAGRYMASNGTFTSTIPSWRAAFLNSPGSTGSNFSFTTPVIPDGTYTVLVRPTDQNGQIGATRTVLGVVVTHPVNNPPVANATVSCNQNVCSFDGRGSTDENPTALTYSWVFGTTQGTATGPIPVKTFTAPGVFPVTLTVRDEWNVTATTTINVTINAPSGNVAPTPTFTASCIALSCGMSSAGTVDANIGDVITYAWNWGDGSPAGVGPTAPHIFAAPGTYVVTMTATDGWGKFASTQRTVVLSEPAGNTAPTASFTATCTKLACQVNSALTVDPQGDQIRYSWNWGDGTAVATTAYPAHTYAVGGTYTITLTATDGWNKSATTTNVVTVAP